MRVCSALNHRMNTAEKAAIALLHRLQHTTLILLGCALLGIIAMVAWARVTVPAEPASLVALDSDDSVIVSRGDWISFRPRDIDPAVGMIFYPGEKAEPAAYGPILHRLATDGFFVVLAPMPLNIALFAPNTARRAMDDFPEVRKWVLAGHGMGGMAATIFASRHPEDLSGLILWAAYPALISNLSGAPWPVLSIAGSLDAISTPTKLAAARTRLPEATRYLEIHGADHWGFGNFNPARSTATIPRDKQQLQTVEATEALLSEIERDHSVP